MSFSLAHNSKKINYRELFSVAQCAKLNYFFALYQNTNYFFLVLIKIKYKLISKIKVNFYFF